MFESKINRGRANGYAPLGSSGKVPLDYLPPIQSTLNTGSFATTGSNTFTGVQTLAGTSGTSWAELTIGQTDIFGNYNSYDIRATGSSDAGISLTSDVVSIVGVVDKEFGPAGNNSVVFSGKYGFPYSDGPFTGIGVLQSGSEEKVWIYDYKGISAFPGDVNIGYTGFVAGEYSGSLNVNKGNINVSGSLNVSGGIVFSDATLQTTAFVPTTYATTSSLNLLTASLNDYTSSNDSVRNRILQTTASLNSKTGSFATTGSNTFYDSQTIVGNVTFPSSSFISTTNASGGLYLSALNQGTLQLNADGGEGDVIIGRSGWEGSLKVIGNQSISGSVYVSSSLVVSSTFVNNGTIDALNSDLIIDGGDIILSGSMYFGSGSSISETSSSIIITPAGAAAGQSLVVRQTGIANLYSDHPSGFYLGDTITLTYSPNNNYLVTGSAPYIFTGCTQEQLGTSLSGSLIYNDESTKTLTWTIPALSDISGFTFEIYNFVFFVSQSISLSSSGSSEQSHIHLVSGDPSLVDIYLGDDDQYVKIEKNAGDVVIGTNLNTHHWRFDTSGSLNTPGDINVSGSIIGSISATNGVVSGSQQIKDYFTFAQTASANTFYGDQSITGSLAINDSATNFLIEGNGFGQAYLTAGGAIVLNPGYGGVEMTGANRSFKATDITADGTLLVKGSTTLGDNGADNTTITGSFLVSGSTTQIGSNTLIGNTVLSGSVSISGSTIQYGNNTIQGNNTITGNTVMSGSINVSGSFTGSMQIDGDLNLQSPHSFYRWGNKLFNYGAFSDTTIQSASVAQEDTELLMRFNTTDIGGNGVYIQSGSRAYVENTGIYNIQFSAQFDRFSSSGIKVLSIWLKKDGNNVPNSCTDIVISGGASEGAVVAAWNFVYPIEAGHYVELAWSTPDHNIGISSLTTRTSPIRPAVPSIILTVTQVA